MPPPEVGNPKSNAKSPLFAVLLYLKSSPSFPANQPLSASCPIFRAKNHRNTPQFQVCRFFQLVKSAHPFLRPPPADPKRNLSSAQMPSPEGNSSSPRKQSNPTPLRNFRWPSPGFEDRLLAVGKL